MLQRGCTEHCGHRKGGSGLGCDWLSEGSNSRAEQKEWSRNVGRRSGRRASPAKVKRPEHRAGGRTDRAAGG